MDHLEPTLVEKLGVASRRMRQFLVDAYAEQLQMNESAVALLKALTDSKQHETQSSLADELCLSDSSLCSLVEKLRKQGLIERQRLIADRRKVKIGLTSRGTTIAETILSAELSMEALLADALRGSDFSEILRALDDVSQACRLVHFHNNAARRAA